MPVELFAPINKEILRDFEITSRAAQISLSVQDSPHLIEFRYAYPLASPEIRGRGNSLPILIPNVDRDDIVAFSMIEAAPFYRAKRVVYDPQSDHRLFSANGSTADELIYVLNLTELILLGEGSTPEERVASIFQKERMTKAVVVKRGALGAVVFERGKNCVSVPAFRSPRVFKIGSGDIFTATFSYFWLERNLGVVEAATFASRNVADYVISKDAKILSDAELTDANFSPRQVVGNAGQIYLAAPFFSKEQRWLLDKMYDALEGLGSKIFSPVHHVGFGEPEDVARQDLIGLDESASVVALLNETDPGSIFEVGYAVAREKPVTIFTEKMAHRDLTMMTGTNCRVLQDFTSVAYNAVWDSIGTDEKKSTTAFRRH